MRTVTAGHEFESEVGLCKCASLSIRKLFRILNINTYIVKQRDGTEAKEFEIGYQFFGEPATHLVLKRTLKNVTRALP